MPDPRTILITDDDPSVGAALRRMPLGDGLLLEFSSLGEAFTAIGKYAAVVATDAALQLPGERSGLDLIKDRFKCPVLMLTASGNHRMEGYARQNGADAVLFKPFTLSEFRRVLGKLLGTKTELLSDVIHIPTGAVAKASDNHPTPAMGSKLAGETVFDALFVEIERRQPLQEGLDAFDVVERGLIRRALVSCNGNQSHAARFLGITRNTLRKRIRKYGFTGLLVGDNTEADDEP